VSRKLRYDLQPEKVDGGYRRVVGLMTDRTRNCGSSSIICDHIDIIFKLQEDVWRYKFWKVNSMASVSILRNR